MPDELIDPSYVDGTTRLYYCREHSLFYRPDERIYDRPTTHCPKGGHRLVSWQELVRGDAPTDEDSIPDAFW